MLNLLLLDNSLFVDAQVLLIHLSTTPSAHSRFVVTLAPFKLSSYGSIGSLSGSMRPYLAERIHQSLVVLLSVGAHLIEIVGSVELLRSGRFVSLGLDTTDEADFRY